MSLWCARLQGSIMSTGLDEFQSLGLEGSKAHLQLLLATQTATYPDAWAQLTWTYVAWQRLPFSPSISAMSRGVWRHSALAGLGLLARSWSSVSFLSRPLDAPRLKHAPRSSTASDLPRVSKLQRSLPKVQGAVFRQIPFRCNACARKHLHAVLGRGSVLDRNLRSTDKRWQ